MKVVDTAGRKVKMQIWDTAGQERFKTINSIYYKGATAIILVYSITDRGSFTNIGNWMEQIKENASEEVTMVLAANKSDLESERQVSFSEGKAIADKFSLPFIETSAKENKNIEELFILLAKNIVEKVGKGDPNFSASNKKYEFTNLEEKTGGEKGGCGC